VEETDGLKFFLPRAAGRDAHAVAVRAAIGRLGCWGRRGSDHTARKLYHATEASPEDIEVLPLIFFRSVRIMRSATAIITAGIDMAWQDSGYYSFWIYRLFVGYARDGEPSDFKNSWVECGGGGHIWCGQFKNHILAIGWALPDDEEALL
jgi:hypothetical protein